jgi:hypothetical protein
MFKYSPVVSFCIYVIHNQIRNTDVYVCTYIYIHADILHEAMGCVHICIYIYIYIYIYMHICIYTHTYAYMYLD